MNNTIKRILTKNASQPQKEEMLDSLSRDIEMARNILSGKYKYCEKCDDYYLAPSFLISTETKEIRICIYQDIINSGGNEYADGLVDIEYLTCPKGHKTEINRHNERQKVK